MSEARTLARSITASLRDREISPDTINRMAGVFALVYPGDDFVAPLVRKLLGRHRHRPGPKRDMARKRRIAAAAKFARYNNTGDKELAAARAATQFGVPAGAVFRAAFERKDSDMRALLRAGP